MSAGGHRCPIFGSGVSVLNRISSAGRSPLLHAAAALLVALSTGSSASGQAQRNQQEQQNQQEAQPQPNRQEAQPQPNRQQPEPRPNRQQAQAAQQRGQPDDGQATSARCNALPDHATVTARLREIVVPGDPHSNGGLANHVWAVTVDREGIICTVTRSGTSIDDQWLGSRAIAASKAFTANAFSLPQFALSTANLYWPSQPESSLYDLGFGNPINPLALYGGEASSWGTPDDPLAGRRVGGTTVFGGGLALYSAEGDLMGALGVSGDESCTDHVIAWRLRDALELDHVPDGPTRDGNDNIIYDLTVHPATGQRNSASGYGHPTCSQRARTIAETFKETASTGARQ